MTNSTSTTSSSILDIPLAFLAYWVSLNTASIFPYGDLVVGALLFFSLRHALQRLLELRNNLRQCVSLLAGSAFGAIIANTICIPTALLATPATETYAALTAVINLSLIIGCARLFATYEPKIMQMRVVRTGYDNTKFVKILDTNALIDGRIEDLVRIKFIEGIIIIPTFVIDELKSIADHNDEIKSTRGKYGLEIAHKLLQLDHVTEYEYDSTNVDRDLVRLAREIDAKIVTADQNLIELARSRNIETINLNEIAVAFQMIHLQGETLKVKVVREGEKSHQGVAYTNDGLLIVVDNAAEYVGEQLRVKITGQLHSQKGVVLFAQPLT